MASIVNFLLIAGIIQGFLFNIVSFCSNRRLSWVVFYLNLCVLFISLNNLQACLIEYNFRSNVPFLAHLLIPWYVCILPMFYMFLIHFLKISKENGSIINFIIILFSAEIVIRCIIISLIISDKTEESVILIYNSIEEIFNLIFTLAIFYKCAKIVFGNPKIFSYMLQYDSLGWLRKFLRLGGMILIFWFSAVLLFNTHGSTVAYYPLRLATSALLYWICYQGFLRFRVLNDRIMLGRFIAATNNLPIAQYAESSNPEILNEKHHRKFSEVNHYILSEMKYLDPYLSIEQLAGDLNMSVSHLSKLVNTFSGYNFSDYINYLRIEEAKKLLTDQSYQNYTNVAIGLESGFNSRSSFYSAFKKFTSSTPSDFREFSVC